MRKSSRLLAIMRSGHAARAITYQTGLTLHEAKEDMRSRTPALRARTLEITNAESPVRIAQRTRKTGSENFPSGAARKGQGENDAEEGREDSPSFENRNL
jgi:hypothetical protein